MNNTSFQLVLLSIISCSTAFGMVFDKRFFPLIQYPYVSVDGRESYATGDFFITTASKATDDTDRDIGVPELLGTFDEAQLGFSFDLAGIPNPLPPLYLAAELPWTMEGKLQSQGFAFSYRQYLGNCFSVGILGLAMRVNSNIDFFFDLSNASSRTLGLTQNDIFFLDDVRRQMFATLGLACNHVQQGGFGDTEIYMRFFDHYKYLFKLRTLEFGFRVGALIPTGVKKNIFKPASVPFGGNGHWGLYVSGDGEFEVREDWKIGVLLRASKRFSRTRTERMPSSKEPQIFGVVVGPAKVDPGFTEIFSCYGQWEGLREGLGLRLQYTLINHNEDNWIDERLDKTVPVNLKEVIRLSGWASEYLTLTAFYDFDKASVERSYKPIVRAAWDIPLTLLVAHRFVKSFKVSLGLEFNF
jgi:hypothetical protein